jgi:hypothetical protein
MPNQSAVGNLEYCGLSSLSHVGSLLQHVEEKQHSIVLLQKGCKFELFAGFLPFLPAS